MNFLYSYWLRLPIATRSKVAAQFGIARTRPTHVVGSEVADDGYAIQHIEAALTIQALNAYTGADSEDREVLWNAMIDKIEGKVINSIVPEPIPVVETPKVEEKVEAPKVKKVVVKKKTNAKAKK